MNIAQFTSHPSNRFYHIVGMPKVSELAHSKYPSTGRTHFFIQIGDTVADLKTQISTYRQVPVDPNHYVIYGILTSIKNARELKGVDLQLFQRGTAIQVYCDASFTEGIIQFFTPRREQSTCPH